MNDPTPTHKNRGRLQLILLALVFFGPLAVAVAMYVTGSAGNGVGNNYGTLLEPPVSVEARLHFDSGLRERWTLIVKPDGDCNEACARALIVIRQVRLATGREIDRIGRALLLTADARVDAQTLAEHPGLVVVTPDDSTGAALSAALAALPNDQVYIMDPIGNVILEYPLEPERKRLLGDLKKLLKLSRIG